jgi:hypothetical protein
MKLYLHIGTEKTGSSFLQSYLAKNRPMLQSHGIYFPNAGKREADMQSGRISPGNASELNTLLSQKSWPKVEQWMKENYKATEASRCNKLLLSNEILVKTLSEPDVMKRFIQISNSAGLDLQDLLLIIREPVGQALSLYKHRSKNGEMQPIVEWLEEKYSLADCLQGFYQIILDFNIGIAQYPYKMDSQYLVEVCINKWLGLKENIVIEHTTVNPSLTLSELKLMSEIKKQDIFLAAKFYEEMLRLEVIQKSPEKNLKKYFSDQINNFMCQHNQIWQRVYNNMSTNSTFKPYSILNVKANDNVSSFSTEQLKTFALLMDYSNSFGYLKLKTISNFKLRIIQIIPSFVMKLMRKLRTF